MIFLDTILRNKEYYNYEDWLNKHIYKNYNIARKIYSHSVLCDVLLFLDENDDGELSVFAKVSIFKVVSKVDEGGDVGGSGGVKGRALGTTEEHAAVMGRTFEVFFLVSVAIV